MKSLTDSEKIRLEKLRKLSPGVQPLEDNLKRIEQSKGKELKEFAIHLAKRLESSERELYELISMLDRSKLTGFTFKDRFRKNIFKLAAELYNNYPGKKRRINSLKIVLGAFLHLFSPNEKQYKWLLSWVTELENPRHRNQGFIKDFQNYRDRTKHTSST